MAVKCQRCRKADTTTGGGPFLTCLNCGAVLMQDGSLAPSETEDGETHTFDEDAPWEPYGAEETGHGFIDPNPTVSYSTPVEGDDPNGEPKDTGFGYREEVEAAEREEAEKAEKPKAKAGKK